MSKCIAITKLGKQCKFNKKGTLFCGKHTISTPEQVILDGGDDFGHIIQYTNETNYFKQLTHMEKQFTTNKQPDADKHNKDIQYKDIQYKDIQYKDNQYADDNIVEQPKPITKCGVCFDDITELNNIIKCSSSECYITHLVCKECLLGHITSMLNDGIASNECIFDKSDKCGGYYTELDIQKAIANNKHMLDKWNETLISSEIIKLAGICDNYLICPLCCRWGCIFETPAGAGSRHAFYIPCGKCGDQWCTLCKRGAHGSRSCYELHFQEEDVQTGMKEKVIDKMLQDIVTRTLTHCCSICGCTYIKEEGCNLMTCPKCNGMSCYICGMKLYYKANTKYWHFTGHDLSDRNATCPLWNNKAGDGKSTNQGNIEYNLQKVEQEFSSFIKANQGNKAIIQLIKERVRAQFGKDKDYRRVVTNILRIVI